MGVCTNKQAVQTKLEKDQINETVKQGELYDQQGNKALITFRPNPLSNPQSFHQSVNLSNEEPIKEQPVKHGKHKPKFHVDADPADEKSPETNPDLPPKKKGHKHRSKSSKLDKQTSLFKLRDLANLRLLDFTLDIMQIIMVNKLNEHNPHYLIQFKCNHRQVEHLVEMTGIMLTARPPQIQIETPTFDIANAESRFWTFFPIDLYFNCHPYYSRSASYFDTLLKIQKRVKQEIEIHSSPTRKGRQQTLLKDDASPGIGKSVGQKKVSEMLEVVTVFDLEIQPLFKNILFHLILQKYLKANQCEDVLVKINDAQFLFDEMPQFDQLQLHRICLFYPNLDFSLAELHREIRQRKAGLNEVCYLRLCHDLVNIVHQTYKNDLFKLRMDLDNVFYIRGDKDQKDSSGFRLQIFNKIRCLLPLETKPEILASNKGVCTMDDKHLFIDPRIDNIEEKNIRSYADELLNDRFIIGDLMMLFLAPLEYEYKDIKKLRKTSKAPETGNKENDFTKWKQFLDEKFNDDNDGQRLIKEYLEKLYQDFETVREDKNIDKTKDNSRFQVNQRYRQAMMQLGELNELKSNLQAAIKNARKRLNDEERERKENMEDNIIENNESMIVEEINDFDNLKLSEEVIQCKKVSDFPYKRMLYNSLFMKSEELQFDSCLQDPNLNTSQKLQTIIMNSFALSNGERSRQLGMLDQAVSILATKPLTSIQTINFHILIKLLQLIPTKPLLLLQQLESLIKKAYDFKQGQHNVKALHKIHTPQGAIEKRKQFYIQLLYAQYYLSNFSQTYALRIMQRLVIQLSKTEKNPTVLQAYALYVNGIVCTKTLQPSSAGINLEMAKAKYELFFPDLSNQHSIAAQQFLGSGSAENIATTNISNIEQSLGMVCFSLNDYDNAIKSLKRALQLRLCQYSEYSDEVLEIVLQILRVYGEQEEAGQALELCQYYARKIQSRKKDEQPIKNKMFAQLQFIMAAIFEYVGCLVSSFFFYKRADESFRISKSHTSQKKFHIQQKKKQIVHKIYIKAQLANNLLASVPVQQFQTISDAVRPYYNSRLPRFYDASKNIVHKPKLAGQMVSAHRCYELKRYSDSLKIYQELIKTLRAEEKDECYGIVLQKLAGIFLTYNTDKYNEEAQKYFKNCIELHEKYLHFPQKEINSYQCAMHLLISQALCKNHILIADLIANCERIKNGFYKTLAWNVSTKYSYNKFAQIFKKVGIKIGYQILDLIQMFDKGIKIQQEIWESSQKNKPISIPDLRAKFVGETIESKQLNLRRSTTFVGTQQRISLKTPKSTNKAVELQSITLIDTVAPSDKKLIEEQQPMTITQVIRDANQKDMINDILKQGSMNKFGMQPESQMKSNSEIGQQSTVPNHHTPKRPNQLNSSRINPYMKASRRQ